jgi:hypothetical protein
VDFKPDDFSIALETKGYRIAWTRTADCPCKPINDQTDQPDPMCTLCEGTGWITFMPAGAVQDETTIGELDNVHQAILADGTYAVVKAIMSAFVAEHTPYDQVTARIEGTANVTVRGENKLGYYDRIVNLDSTIAYAQILESDGAAVLESKYWVRDVNLLRSVNRVYAKDTDFEIIDARIQWVTPPAPGTRLVLHYLTHPVWRIISHPHSIRASLLKFKTASPSQPLGDPIALPVQGVAQLEFLIGLG